MAEGTKLSYSVGTINGKKTWSFSRAKPGATTSSIRALAQGLLTNSALFRDTPIAINSAKLITTTETEIDIS